jgi:hypothetical protein
MGKERCVTAALSRRATSFNTHGPNSYMSLRARHHDSEQLNSQISYVVYYTIDTDICSYVRYLGPVSPHTTHQRTYRIAKHYNGPSQPLSNIGSKTLRQELYHLTGQHGIMGDRSRRQQGLA